MNNITTPPFPPEALINTGPPYFVPVTKNGTVIAPFFTEQGLPTILELSRAQLMLHPKKFQAPNLFPGTFQGLEK